MFFFFSRFDIFSRACCSQLWTLAVHRKSFKITFPTNRPRCRWCKTRCHRLGTSMRCILLRNSRLGGRSIFMKRPVTRDTLILDWILFLFRCDDFMQNFHQKMHLISICKEHVKITNFRYKIIWKIKSFFILCQQNWWRFKLVNFIWKVRQCLTLRIELSTILRSITHCP